MKNNSYENKTANNNCKKYNFTLVEGFRTFRKYKFALAEGFRDFGN
jgi:hypothetical protein